MRNVWKMPQLLQQFMNCGTSQIRTVSFQTSVIQWDKDLQIPPLNLRFFPSSSLKLPVENDTCLAKSSIFWHRFPAFPNWLVVDLPLWKIWVRQLGPIYGKIKKMFQTTNQCLLVSSQIYYIRRARAPGSYKLIYYPSKHYYSYNML